MNTTPEIEACKGQKCFHQKQEEILFFLNKVLNHNRMWNVWGCAKKGEEKKGCSGQRQEGKFSLRRETGDAKATQLQDLKG